MEASEAPEEAVTYADLRDTLDTLDLVFFSGKGNVSSFIKRHTESKWSHCGMVVRINGLLFLWESTTLSDQLDVFAGKRIDGVQLVRLGARIAWFHGEIGIRRLENFPRTDLVLGKLWAHMLPLHGLPYESSTLALIRAQLDRFGAVGEEDLSSVFCSELVAAAYKVMGLLPKDISASEYVPEDMAYRYLTLEGGATLSDLVEVT